MTGVVQVQITYRIDEAGVEKDIRINIARIPYGVYLRNYANTRWSMRRIVIGKSKVIAAAPEDIA